MPNYFLRVAGGCVTGNDTSGKIRGLQCRIKNPLEFLGLYKTCYGACTRVKIPAKRISGNGNEEQLLNAATAYIDRPKVLHNVLADIIVLLKLKKIMKMDEILMITIESLYRYWEDKDIQLIGR